MRKGLSDLAIVSFVSILCVLLAIFTSGIARIGFGICLILLIPGYALMAALYIKKNSIGLTVRFGLSFGLSIIVATLFALALNYTSWGINTLPLVICISTFTLAMCIVAWLRRKSISTDRFDPKLYVEYSKILHWFRGHTSKEKLSLILLIVTVISVFASIAYFVAVPEKEKYTEVYFLSMEGNIGEYPRELNVGEEFTGILVIVNHEGEEQEYRAQILLDEVVVLQIDPFVILDEGEREQNIAFTPDIEATHNKVELNVYMGQNEGPYRSLHFWVDIVT